MRNTITSVIGVGYLLLLAMAWIPQLHQWLHGAAGDSDDHCGVVMIIDGQIRDAESPQSAPHYFERPGRVLVLPTTRIYRVAVCASYVLEHAPPIS